jgi:NADP-dependent 3-hydroxy acid dehydrogenase YdfG
MRDKVIVITGASAGIGRAAAGLLAQRGARLVLVARRKELLDEVAVSCGANADAAVADVTRRDEVNAVAARALARFGRIDVWINNAGRGISRMPSELTDEDVDEMMLVNVKSALYGMQAVLPHFKARGDGHIINISSMLGRVPFAVIRSAYSASKHFLNAITANIREEIHATHPQIQVSLVLPGVVATEFGLHARHGGVDSRAFPGAQTPEDVAQVIADVIESRRADVYTRPDGRQMVARYYATDIAG